MEVDFNIEKILGNSYSKNNVSIITPQFIKNLGSNEMKKISNALDNMGYLSAKAQGLKNIITTTGTFTINNDQKLYIHAQGNKLNGILKTGVRKLFIYDSLNNIKEIKPLCVLDFYVHESQQRNGLGKILFEAMLKEENSEAAMIAYDRPSEKLLSFLSKHYSLVKYTPQNNNFVVYEEYFNKSRVNNKRKNFGSIGGSSNNISGNTTEDKNEPKIIGGKLVYPNKLSLDNYSYPNSSNNSNTRAKSPFLRNNNYSYNDKIASKEQTKVDLRAQIIEKNRNFNNIGKQIISKPAVTPNANTSNFNIGSNSYSSAPFKKDSVKDITNQFGNMKLDPNYVYTKKQITDGKINNIGLNSLTPSKMGVSTPWATNNSANYSTSASNYGYHYYSKGK